MQKKKKKKEKKKKQNCNFCYKHKKHTSPINFGKLILFHTLKIHPC